MIMRVHSGFRKQCAAVAVLLFAATCGHAQAARVRAPVVAGQFYPATATELNRTIAELVAGAQKADPDVPAGFELKALVIPHAGYMYAGSTAAHCVRILSGRHFSKVVVMGPDHRVGIRGAAISAVSAYHTPLGRIGLHEDSKQLRESSTLFEYSPVSDRIEHSVEVVLPFLQYALDEFQMVPVVIGGGDPRAIAAALAPIMDPGTLLVASSDLSHFLPYDRAVAWDRATLRLILQLKPGELMRRPNSACGRAAVAVILHLARQRDWRPIVLDYTNSGDTAGDRSRVVGYAAVAFYGPGQTRGANPMENCFNAQHGDVLLDHARRTIMAELGREYGREASMHLEEKLKDACFDTQSGTFVTLTLKGRLRGCIGNMSTTLNLRDGVRQNAISAAFHDPRFKPLTDAELDQVHIEISILTEPQPLAHEGGDDLIARLRPNIDGVIIAKGINRATFLPQVWKQLPRPDDFLKHLCMKAGLPADTWQSEGLAVQTYQVISFEEEP